MSAQEYYQAGQNQYPPQHQGNHPPQGNYAQGNYQQSGFPHQPQAAYNSSGGYQPQQMGYTPQGQQGQQGQPPNGNKSGGKGCLAALLASIAGCFACCACCEVCEECTECAEGCC